MKKIAILGLLALSCMLASGVSSAHARFHGGIYIGGPVWVPPPVYYPPAYYPPPVYVEHVAPPVYVEQNPAPAVADYWYYCQESKAYYPYVQSCPSNWMKVVPNSPSGGQPPPR